MCVCSFNTSLPQLLVCDTGCSLSLSLSSLLQLLQAERHSLDGLFFLSSPEVHELAARLCFPPEEEGKLVASLKKLSACYREFVIPHYVTIQSLDLLALSALRSVRWQQQQEVGMDGCLSGR